MYDCAFLLYAYQCVGMNALVLLYMSHWLVI